MKSKEEEEKKESNSTIASEIASKLQAVFYDMVPGEKHHQKKGQLDVRSLYKFKVKKFDFFKRPGEAMPKLDIVLLVDKSGSTEGQVLMMENECATGILKATQRFPQIRMAIMYFNSHPFIVKSLHSRAFKTPRRADGGTSFDNALHEANRLLRHSSAKYRFILVLTDGKATLTIKPLSDYYGIFFRKIWSTFDQSYKEKLLRKLDKYRSSFGPSSVISEVNDFPEAVVQAFRFLMRRRAVC